MGSLATSEMIFFIATLVISASVVGVLGGQTFHITQSMDQSTKSISNTIDSSFELINNPSQIPYSNGYVFYVKNTGSIGIDFTNTSVSTILNGTLLTGSDISYQTPDGSGLLSPGQVGEIVVKIPLSAGTYTISVTLSGGTSHSMVFQIS